MKYLGIHIPTAQPGVGHQKHNTYEDSEKFFTKFPDKYKDYRVVFLHRDPRDVVVSSYYHYTKRNRLPYDGTISDFIRDPYQGIEKITRWNLLFKEHMNAENFLYISYEDMHSDLYDVVQKSLVHFKLNAAEEDIQRGIKETSDFDNMKRMELADKKKMKWTDLNDNDTFKAREGKVGSHVNHLNQDDIDYCNDILEKHEYFKRMYAAV